MTQSLSIWMGYSSSRAPQRSEIKTKTNKLKPWHKLARWFGWYKTRIWVKSEPSPWNHRLSFWWVWLLCIAIHTECAAKRTFILLRVIPAVRVSAVGVALEGKFLEMLQRCHFATDTLQEIYWEMREQQAFRAVEQESRQWRQGHFKGHVSYLTTAAAAVTADTELLESGWG